MYNTTATITREEAVLFAKLADVQDELAFELCAASALFWARVLA